MILFFSSSCFALQATLQTSQQHGRPKLLRGIISDKWSSIMAAGQLHMTQIYGWRNPKSASLVFSHLHLDLLLKLVNLNTLR